MTNHAVLQRPLPPWAIGLAGLLSLAVAMGIGRFAFTPLLPLMVQAGQLDLAAGGWIAAANYAGYLLGALTASRTGWAAPRLALVALVATAVLTAAMAPGGPTVWLAFLRLLAGVASAWAFVGTSIWCLSALASVAPTSWSSALYAGVGIGVALAGLDCLLGATAGWSAEALWIQLGVLAALLIAAGRVGPSTAAGQHQGRRRATAGTHACRQRRPGRLLRNARLRLHPARHLPAGVGALAGRRSTPVRAGLAGVRRDGRGVHRGGGRRAAPFLAPAGLVGVPPADGIGHAAAQRLAVGLDHRRVGLAGRRHLHGGHLAGVQEIRARARGDATRLVGFMTAAFAIGQIAGPVASALLLRVSPAHGLDLALQAGAASLFASAAWLWRATPPISSPQPETSHAR
jgi:MFS family permease